MSKVKGSGGAPRPKVRSSGMKDAKNFGTKAKTKQVNATSSTKAPNSSSGKSGSNKGWWNM